MTIKERQEREAHDRENPWRAMAEAKVGLICDLLFDDMVGHYSTERVHYVLDSDGIWYRIDREERVWVAPINWRPAHVFMTPERRALMKRRANDRSNQGIRIR
jgi:hypothetical protein